MTKWLIIKNFNIVPFQSYVKEIITKGLEGLTTATTGSSVLQVDFTGSKKTDYELTFENKYSWNEYNRDGCWYHPGIEGVTGRVYMEAISKRNYCKNINDCKTCEPVFRHTPSELGKAISFIALHELGHLFGLMDKSSYTGANDGGHTGDPTNPMFMNLLHKDYKPLTKDYDRTTKYVIKKNDTLSGVAAQKGLRPPIGTWEDLYNLKGRDGQSNRDILRSGNPNVIYPDEEIWVPDIQKRLEFMREVDLKDKSFTKTQIDFMRKWINEGRSIIEVR